MKRASSGTIYVLGIPKHPTMLFSARTTQEARGCEGDYTLLYPHWYRTDQAGIFQAVGTSRVPASRVTRTRIHDWRLEVETLVDQDLDASIHAYQITISYAVFFDAATMSNWQEDTPRCFPPHASVHLEPYLYRTTARGRLQVLGFFSPRVPHSPADFMERFWSLTGLDRNMTILPFPRGGNP